MSSGTDRRVAVLDPRLGALWHACLDGRDADLHALAAPLRDAAAWAPWLDVLLASLHHRNFEHEPRDALLARAEAEFRAREDAAGLAACRSLGAARIARTGRWNEAIDLLNEVEALPRAQRCPFERYVTLGRLRNAHWYNECYDEALRDSLRLVESAHELHAPSLEAQALTLLGGMQADLFNLDDALRHCERAWQMVQSAPAASAHVIGLVQRNLAYTLDALGRNADALAQIDDLAREAETSPATENDSLMYATVLLHAGHVGRAQAWLDRSVAERAGAHGDTNAWTATQAELWLTQGDAARARAACETYLRESAHEAHPSRSPPDTVRMHRACARACAMLGDAAGALASQEAAFACYEALVGRAARARRITFEMEHSLERERWERELAEQRQREAEAERERLGQLNLALEAAMLAKTRFLAAASHDLRQPVQALMMYTAALKHEADHAARAGLMSRLDTAVAALATMFDALLDVSRLDAGVVSTDVREFPLLPLLDRLADECRSVAGTQQLEVRLYRPRAAALARTRSDAVLLERCVRNLLDNARKYTTRGGIVLALRQARDASSPGWRIEVRDTGIGIEQADLQHVFDEFFQVGAPASRPDEPRGLGLGLSIVKRLAQMLGHPVGIRSWPGRGTLVWIELPAVADAPAMAGAIRPGDSTPLPDDDPVRVLAVVEDDAEVRAALVALLTQWRHRVFAGTDANSVLHAWQNAARPPLDAIVSDLRLAGPHDGIDAIATLRAHAGTELPALILTGETDPDQRHRLNESTLPWLAKPVQPARLRSWLRSLGHRSAQA